MMYFYNLVYYLVLLTTTATANTKTNHYHVQAKRSSSSMPTVGFVQRQQSLSSKNLYYDLRLGERNRHSLLLLQSIDNNNDDDPYKQSQSRHLMSYYLSHQNRRQQRRQWRPFISKLNKQGRHNNMNHRFSSRSFASTTKRSASLTKEQEEGNNNTVEITSNRNEMISLMVWITTMSSFLLVNYFGKAPWPESLIFSFEFKHWSLMHALCGMLFSGTIILSTLIEWLVVSLKKSDILKFWFTTVPQLDALVVLPALTGTVLSGVAQSCHLYGKFSEAPKHITGTIHVLVAFGLWWVITDVTTQQRTKQVVTEMVEDDNNNQLQALPSVLRVRRISNIISCILVVALYAIMILKPGYQ